MSDYKTKYLKYKSKYLQLKKLEMLSKSNLDIKNKNVLVGGVKTFTVKNNDGSNGNIGYSNQCMWLSILDFLNGVLGNNLTLEEIRNIASNNGNDLINGKLERFDDEKHIKALTTITELFDLQIHIYPLLSGINIQENVEVISDDPISIVGNYSAPNIVSIVSYGDHFNLITSIEGRKLYQGKIKNIDNFIPNPKLALGINEDISKLNKKEIKNLDELVNQSVNLERIKKDCFEELRNINRELKELELTDPVKNQELRTTLGEETFKVVIESFNERKAILAQNKTECNRQLRKIRKSLEEIKKNIYNLISKV